MQTNFTLIFSVASSFLYHFLGIIHTHLLPSDDVLNLLMVIGIKFFIGANILTETACRILDNLPVAVLRQRRDGILSTTYEHGFRVGFKGNYAGVSLSLLSDVKDVSCLNVYYMQI